MRSSALNRCRLSPQRCVAIMALLLLTLPVILLMISLALSRDKEDQHRKHSLSVDYVYFENHEMEKKYHVTPGASTMDLLDLGEKRMTARRRTLLDACAELMPEQRLAPREFLISDHPALVFCPVYRAAATTWIANMLQFRGARLPKGCGRGSKGPSELPMTLIRKHYPNPSTAQLTRALATSPSLIIVRHPLDRLLSAYRDASDTSDNSNAPTFPAFAEHVLEEHRAGRTLDSRWAPISTFCSPCAASFSYIAKVETLAADQKYLFLAEPALVDAGGTANWCHPSRRGIPTTSALSARYFTSLPTKLVRELAQMYAEDFRLFGYSLHGYLAD